MNRKPSPKQAKVLEYVRRNGKITVPEAVELIGGNVYANQAFHCGNVLRNMAEVGLLRREKRGVYIAAPIECYAVAPAIREREKSVHASQVMPAMREWARNKGLIP